MWPDATSLPGRIYFNVVTTSSLAGSAVSSARLVSPNVAALGTHVEPPASERHVALFGVWVDCNGDGYIGMAEGALREYGDALLLDDSTCPRIIGPPNTWTMGAHNYNGRVTELVPIGRGTYGDCGNSGTCDLRIHLDQQARVWGDFDRPDERPMQRACALQTLPSGTVQSTGGLLDYVDCHADVLGAWNGAMGAVEDPLALRFADTDDAHSGPLGAVQTLGSEDAEHSAATVVACGSGDIVNSGDYVGGDIGVPALSPQLGNTNDPTVPGTFNRTWEDLAEDCDTSNDDGRDTYGLVESNVAAVDLDEKRRADWNFAFVRSGRGGLPLNLVPGGGNSGGSGIPSDAGVGIGGSRWESDSTWTSKLGPRLVRADLWVYAAGLPNAYWLSFYARVGSATFARGFSLPGGSGVYGAWHCAGEDSGIHHAWNCDPDAWYTNAGGAPQADPEGLLARPGLDYQLRDVDCYDGEVAAVQLGILPAFYGPDPCP